MNDDITLRERDNCYQVRIPIDDLCTIINKLITNKIKWSYIVQHFKKYKQSAGEKIGKI